MTDNINVLSMLRFKACQDLFYELNSISYALIKGEALSLQAYGVLGRRFSDDIDILIHRDDIKIAENILQKM